MLHENPERFNPSANGYATHYTFPPCPSDYPPAPKLEAPAHVPSWRDELAPLTHSLKWVDHDRHEHSLTLRADDLDALLLQLRTVKAFIAASKVRAEAPAAPSLEPQAGQADNAYAPQTEQADPAYDEPGRPTRIWCEKHGTWSNLREKNGERWYSHRCADGWCRRNAK